ncbi:MAG: hypothetical protein H6821_05565 [Planctomycetaceae bacterium]|nr:hypothetical protein [Planctomycetaceae bacterium]MCB9940180.1 hypothetical protein [Planctomycetaceae bacterium]HRX79607.1 hypothetical protein [Pirellulaceae bacterium]
MATKPYQFAGKGLSIAQPWASSIAFAGKSIENRSWRTHYRGPLAIHASGTLRRDAVLLPLKVERGGKKRPVLDWINKGRKKYGQEPEDESVIVSHIVAIAMLVDCVDRSSSVWFHGDWGWVLEGVIPIEPIPWVGGLGVWDCKFKYQPLRKKA